MDPVSAPHDPDHRDDLPRCRAGSDLHFRARLLRRSLPGGAAGSSDRQGEVRRRRAAWQDSGGNPHAVLTFGLFVLTLVPLARVAFCFILFIRERDYTYVAFTAYVLA